MKELNEMSLEELKEYLEEKKKYAEGWKNCQDGSYEMYWHYNVQPVIDRIKELEENGR